MKTKPQFSARRLLATTTIAIITVYMLLTYVLPNFWATHRDWVETLAEAILVGITATLILYLFWYQPLLREMIMRDEVERTLKSLQTEFSTSVQHRGRELADTRKRLVTETHERIRLAGAVEHASDAILITNAEGRIAHVNRAWEQTTGYSRSELMGESPGLLRCVDHQMAFDGGLTAILQRAQPWRGPLVNRRKDGTPYTAQVSIVPTHSNNGQLIGTTIVVERGHPQPVAATTKLA
ncbi:MAG: PAS domain S-box protein [Verrucomicrobia bacterium]|nr:PAS domain S-box protein [Verrucomicrobiota bacterium]